MKRQCKLGKERQNTIKSLITLRIEQETELEPQHKFKRKEENNAMILPTLLSPGGLNDAAVVQTPRVLFPRFPPCSSTAWMAVPYLPPLSPQQSRSSSVSSLRMRSSRVQLEVSLQGAISHSVHPNYKTHTHTHTRNLLYHQTHLTSVIL